MHSNFISETIEWIPISLRTYHVNILDSVRVPSKCGWNLKTVNSRNLPKDLNIVSYAGIEQYLWNLKNTHQSPVDFANGSLAPKTSWQGLCHSNPKDTSRLSMLKTNIYSSFIWNLVFLEYFIVVVARYGLMNPKKIGDLSLRNTGVKTLANFSGQCASVTTFSSFHQKQFVAISWLASGVKCDETGINRKLLCYRLLKY